MELSADVNTYRDALRFRNGQHVKLQELSEGQRITVLDIGGECNEEDDLEQNRAIGADLVPRRAAWRTHRVTSVRVALVQM